jgi:hypothetical protein
LDLRDSLKIMGEKRQFSHKIEFEGAKLIFKIFFTLLLSQMV